MYCAGVATELALLLNSKYSSGGVQEDTSDWGGAEKWYVLLHAAGACPLGIVSLHALRLLLKSLLV